MRSTLLESLGHRVEEVPLSLDERFAGDFVHYWAMLCYAVRRGGARLYDPSFDPSRLLPVTHGLADRVRRDWRRTLGTIRRLRASGAGFEAAQRGCDVLLTPTLAHLPPDLGWLGVDAPYEVLFPRVERWVSFTPLANATGAPAISLPLGHDPATNLPVGTMLSGRMGDDGLLVRLALQLEAAEPFPSLADPSLPDA
ncbi:MAG: amidase family protein [Acidimicrobiales bacterium]